MTHRLEWTPGNWGKGLVDADGSVVTWNTNGQYGDPHHAEILTGDMMDTPMAHRDHHAFEIHPDGNLEWSMLAPKDPEVLATIEAADPNLHMTDDGFEFHGADQRQRWLDYVPQYIRPSALGLPTAPRMARTASKLEWLENRPDFQKPEKKPLLKWMQQKTESIGDKLDPLLPWIAREVKKGRLTHEPARPPNGAGWLIDPDPNNQVIINDAYLAHMADWYGSDSPTRRGADIMQLTYPDVRERMNQWNTELQLKQQEADRESLSKAGEIVHKWPDNWSIRRLDPEDLDDEGDAMGHCVGGYGYEDEVRNNNALIYSLRDDKGQPHATAEIRPTQWENPAPGGWPDEKMNEGVWDDNQRDRVLYNEDYGAPTESDIPAMPHNGQIIQIQGKGDAMPIPEYQQRFKDWFGTFPEEQRPYFYSDEDATEANELMEHPEYDERQQRNEGYGYDQGGYGPHGDYGVDVKQEADYESMLRNTLETAHAQSRGGYAAKPDMYDLDAMYTHALKNGKIPELAKDVESFGQEQQENFDDWRMMNDEYATRYPQGDEQYPLNPGDEGYPIPETHYEYGEMIPDAEDHEKRYDADVEQWENEHPGMQMTSYLYRLLGPHWGPQHPDVNPGDQAYTNELHSDPAENGSSQHPAQEQWAKQQGVFSSWRESSTVTDLREWLAEVDMHLSAKHKKKPLTQPKPWVPLKDQYDAMKRVWYDSDDGEGSALEFPYEAPPWRKEHHAPIPQLAHKASDAPEVQWLAPDEWDRLQPIEPQQLGNDHSFTYQPTRNRVLVGTQPVHHHMIHDYLNARGDNEQRVNGAIYDGKNEIYGRPRPLDQEQIEKALGGNDWQFNAEGW